MVTWLIRAGLVVSSLLYFLRLLATEKGQLLLPPQKKGSSFLEAATWR